tara:strand:- start:1616 stop:2062 length:447 start_codon:yes stop_codon:yes gene_type:complete
MEDIFNKLKSLHQPKSSNAKLPTETEIKEKETKYGINFPPTYQEFLKKYSNLSVGFYEPFMLNRPDVKFIDFDTNVKEAWEDGLSKEYLPFLTDNGDYFCFDLTTKAPDFEVVLMSHEMEEERWENFLDWVENCWIQESLEEDEESFE